MQRAGVEGERKMSVGIIESMDTQGSFSGFNKKRKIAGAGA